MTDHESEQQMELEALEAIFMDDLREYTGSTPSGWVATGKTYIMDILPFEEGEEVEGTSDEELKMELLWAHTPRYPEEGPSLHLSSVYGLTDGEVASCSAELQSVVEQNLGMAMIYTLISAAKEWLRNRASQSLEEDPEVVEKRLAAEEEARRQAARAHGTPVTVEAFKAWKAKYDAELAAIKAKALEGVKDDDKAKRVTGKAWFMQDRSEVATEAGALSEDDEADIDLTDEVLAGEDEEEYDFDEEDDVDDEDYLEESDEEDDEELLQELSKKAGLKG